MANRATYPSADLEVLEQVVADPRFKKLATLPLWPWAEIGLLVGVYGSLFLSSALYLNGALPYWVVIIVNTFAIYASFTPLHDAAHRSVSSHPLINDWIGNFGALLLLPGFTSRFYRYLHLEHHRHTGDPERDPDDIFVAAPMPWRLVICMFLDIHWGTFYLRTRKGRPIAEQRRAVLSVAFVVLWHLGWLLSPYAWEFVLLWLIPQRLGLIVLTYLFASIQHPNGLLQDERPLQATRMMYGGVPVRWFMLSQSEHLVHHMFPAIPYYRYHGVWKIAAPWFARREIVWSWPIPPLAMPGPQHSENKQAVMRARVCSVDDVATDVRAYTLEPADDTAFPEFSPGSHLDVHIGEGLVRQYSLTHTPRADSRYRIAVKREDKGRGGSRTLHSDFVVGRDVDIGEPRNHFRLDDNATTVCLVAGGIGITPLLSMAESLHTRRTEFALHVCARSRADLPFGSELAQSPWARSLSLHLDDGPQQQQLSVETLPAWTSGAQMYLCGPPGFMSYVIGLAESRGWPGPAIHTESFVASRPDPASDRAFELVLQRTGRTLQVPADRSALEVLQEARIPVAASCTQGLCGSCVCTAIEGEVDHRDAFLGDHDRAAGKFTACVSRAVGARLVVDL